MVSQEEEDEAFSRAIYALDQKTKGQTSGRSSSASRIRTRRTPQRSSTTTNECLQPPSSDTSLSRSSPNANRHLPKRSKPPSALNNRISTSVSKSNPRSSQRSAKTSKSQPLPPMNPSGTPSNNSPVRSSTTKPNIRYRPTADTQKASSASTPNRSSSKLEAPDYAPAAPKAPTPEEDLSQLSDADRKKRKDRKKSIAAKLKGNELYKSEKFDEAIVLYDEAIVLDDTNMAFHSNKAAVYFTAKKYDECIEACNKAVEVGNDNRAPFEERAKALTRAAKAYEKKGDIAMAIAYCNKAQLENFDKATQQLLKTLELEKRKADTLVAQPKRKSAKSSKPIPKCTIDATGVTATSQTRNNPETTKRSKSKSSKQEYPTPTSVAAATTTGTTKNKSLTAATFKQPTSRTPNQKSAQQLSQRPSTKTKSQLLAAKAPTSVPSLAPSDRDTAPPSLSQNRSKGSIQNISLLQSLPVASTAQSDEKYARKLQQQIDQEESTNNLSRPLSQPQTTHSANSFEISDPPTSDEAFARRLQEKMREEVDSQHNDHPSPKSVAVYVDTEFEVDLEQPLPPNWYQQHDKSIRRSGNSKLPRDPPAISLRDWSEIEQVKVVAQEAEDAELAYILTQTDKDEYAAQREARREALNQHASQNNGISSPPSRKSKLKRVLNYCLPATVVVAAIVGLYIAFGGNAATGFIWDNDPFDGVNNLEAHQWQITGTKRGLTLEVLNACDEEWGNYFDVALADWNDGTPNALNLSSTRVNVDRNCSAVRGKLKVCNKDYGNTEWKGVNQILLRNNWIVQSVAKMNDFYLKGSDKVQWRYTMCHEMGHGFGLTHTDENFNNRNLGNCMDYTNNVESNKQPDASNFQLLMEWYGVVDNMNPNRNLRQLRRRNELYNDDEHYDRYIKEDHPIPEEIMKGYSDALEVLDINQLSEGNWELMHVSKGSKAASFRLDEEYTIVAHMLLAEQ